MNNPNKSKERADLLVNELLFTALLAVFAAAVLAGSILIWIEHSEINSPGLFPTIVAAIMLICVVVVLVAGLREYSERKARGEYKSEGLLASAKRRLKLELPFRTTFMILMILLYAVGFQVFGFYIATGAFLLVTILVFYKGKYPLRAVIITIGMLAGIYLIIQKLFHVRF